MPLRRHPPELSPRLRMLLGAGSDPPGGGAAVLTVAGTQTTARPEEEWWTPSRAWLEGVSDPGEDVERAPAVEDGGTGRTTALHAGRHRAEGAPRLLNLPTPLVGARVATPTRAVVGLLLVALVAAGVLGARVLLARAEGEPHPVAPGGSSDSTPVSLVERTATPSSTAAPTPGGAGAAGVAGAAAPGAAAPVAAGTVVVHVVGQVARPGLVELPGGSRVSDAVTAAGGATSGADLSGVNLARLVLDGEQLRVPKPGEVLPAGSPVPGGTGGGASGGGGSSGQPVDLNTADLSALDSLPGVGPVLAQRILDWRTEHGRFTNIDELGEVSGIGEKVMANLQPLVRV